MTLPWNEIYNFALYDLLLPFTVALVIGLTMRRNVAACFAIGCGVALLNYTNNLIDWSPNENSGSAILLSVCLMLIACQSPLAPGSWRLTTGIAWRAAAVFFAARFLVPPEIIRDPTDELPGMGLRWFQLAMFPVLLGGTLALEYMAVRLPNWATSFCSLCTAGTTAIFMLLAGTTRFAELCSAMSMCWFALFLLTLARSIRVFPAIASLQIFITGVLLTSWSGNREITNLPTYAWALIGAAPIFTALLHLVMNRNSLLSRTIVLSLVWLIILAAALVVGFQFEKIAMPM